MSLATRLLLMLLVPVAVCFAIQGYVNVRLRRRAMLDEATREVRDNGTALEVAIDAFLRDHNLADMAQLTEDLSRAERILGVMVFDANDHPVEASHSVMPLRDAFADLAGAARRTHAARSQIRSRGGRELFAYAFPIGRGGRVAGSAIVLRDLGYVDVNMRAYARQLAAVASAVMAFVAIGLWLALRHAVLAPVSTLVKGFERVASGALDVEIAVSRRDEMGRMAAAFNRMTHALRAARDELETKSEANVTLERRLHHAQRLALIGQLAASVAHQIGSPLNVIVGRARYALKQGGQSERDTKHLQEIVAGAEAISGVIERLLSQARRVRPRAGEVDLGQLARETLRFLDAECERAEIDATVDSEGDVRVAGRRDELEQVILNLCMNAIQAQPTGGRLHVRVRRVDASDGHGEVEVAVTDAGPGVPEQNRAQIFEPFFTTKAPKEGTGLGLAICEEIIRRHGGTIVVADAVNGGAEFRVSLPVAAPASIALQRKDPS